MYWYVLFVRTGRERKVEKLLKERLDTEMFMPFIPLEERILKILGTIKKEWKPLLPRINAKDRHGVRSNL